MKNLNFRDCLLDLNLTCDPNVKDIPDFLSDECVYHNTRTNISAYGLVNAIGDMFGFCGCGCPEYELDKLRETLQIIKDADMHEHPELTIREVAEIRKPFHDLKDGYQIYLYLLNDRGFTEHGSVITGSWLNFSGYALLQVLNLLKASGLLEWED